MTRIGIITQARMTSTRLPGKVLLEAGGKTMLAHHLERLHITGLPIIVATTRNAADDPIIEHATRLGASTYRGDEHDVLSRFAEAATQAELDTVVRVTSDCPLIDPNLISQGVERFQQLDDPNAHVSNVIERTYPRGFDFEVFSTSALLDAATNANQAAEREHVTPYLYTNRSGRTTLHTIRREHDASRYRVTLDTPQDLALLSELIDTHDAANSNAEQIITILDTHPELPLLNAAIEQKKLGH